MLSDLRPVASFVALLSREQYVTCRIVLPDEPRPLAAIRLGERYYSFFRVAPDAEQALVLVTKLCYNNNQVVLVKTAKGYSLWVEEVEAFPHGFPRLTDDLPEPAFCRILMRQTQYKFCSLNVPDLDKTIPGIEFKRQYYSIFRKEPSAESAIQIVAQLSQRDDESVLLAHAEGWTICIAEPEAIMALMAV